MSCLCLFLSLPGKPPSFSIVQTVSSTSRIQRQETRMYCNLYDCQKRIPSARFQFPIYDLLAYL